MRVSASDVPGGVGGWGGWGDWGGRAVVGVKQQLPLTHNEHINMTLSA